MMRRPFTAPTAHSDSASRDVERARALALRFGWNAVSYQVVNAGMQHWFSAEGDAVVGYVQAHQVCVVAGAPICDGDRLSAVLAEWESFVTSIGCRCCYFGAAGRVYDALHGQPGYSSIEIGAQPVWIPDAWHDTVERTPSLRRQFLRARNKDVIVAEWPPDRVSSDPRVRACLDAWLRRRGLPTLHFLVEPDTLHDLRHRRVFVAERGGDVVGFVNASPIPARQGWLLEQFVRSDAAPNGTIELLVDHMMRAVSADGAQYVTLGLAPLHLRREESPAPPRWLDLLFTIARAHGRRFYNFEGLDRFKSKLRPHAWEPIYAISTETAFSLRTVYAIASAFTTASPAVTIVRGAGRALRTELTRLRRRVTGNR